jgi:hypothetical protein
VSCTSAKRCVAVGDYPQNSVTVSLTELWNGNTWTHATSPNPAGATDTQLSGVSCPVSAPLTCFAVGAYAVGSSVGTLIERYG